MSTPTEEVVQVSAEDFAAFKQMLADQAQQIEELRADNAARAAAGRFADQEMSSLTGAPPKSHPGRVEDKLVSAATSRGGQYFDGRTLKYVECQHARPESCDDCWTKETETRWLKAVGRLPQNSPSVALFPLEDRASQRANEPTSTADRQRTGRVRST